MGLMFGLKLFFRKNKDKASTESEVVVPKPPRSKGRGCLRFGLIGCGGLLALVVIVPVLLLLLSLFTPLLVDRQAIAGNVTLTRIFKADRPTPHGYITTPFLKDTDHTYINIAADFNQDEKIQSYKTSGGDQSEWIVQNMPVRAYRESNNSFSIQIPDTAIDGRKDIKVLVVLSSDRFKDWDGQSYSGQVAAFEGKIAEIKKDDFSGVAQPSPGFRSGFGFIAGLGSRPSPAVHAEGNSFSVYHAGVPDLNQGTNECAPTSSANSVLWLAKSKGLADKLPSAAADTIREMRTAMKWRREGVTDANLNPGIATFAKDHGLDLQTNTFANDPANPNVVSDIADQLKAGRDVLVAVTYVGTDQNGNEVALGGHVMTVVGAFFDGIDTFLFLNDPATRNGGADVYKINGRLIQNYAAGVATRIDFAVAEQLNGALATPTPTTAPTPPTTPTSPTTPVPPTPTPTPVQEKGPRTPILVDIQQFSGEWVGTFYTPAVGYCAAGQSGWRATVNDPYGPNPSTLDGSFYDQSGVLVGGIEVYADVGDPDHIIWKVRQKGASDFNLKLDGIIYGNKDAGFTVNGTYIITSTYICPPNQYAVSGSFNGKKVR